MDIYGGHGYWPSVLPQVEAVMESLLLNVVAMVNTGHPPINSYRKTKVLDKESSTYPSTINFEIFTDKGPLVEEWSSNIELTKEVSTSTRCDGMIAYGDKEMLTDPFTADFGMTTDTPQVTEGSSSTELMKDCSTWTDRMVIQEHKELSTDPWMNEIGTCIASLVEVAHVFTATDEPFTKENSTSTRIAGLNQLTFTEPWTLEAAVVKEKPLKLRFGSSIDSFKKKLPPFADIENVDQENIPPQKKVPRLRVGLSRREKVKPLHVIDPNIIRAHKEKLALMASQAEQNSDSD